MPQHALVVDDDLEMCKVIQAILHSTDTEALISTDSAHAVELLHNQKFDSVFLDVNMPPPDGIELTRLIRASGPNQKTPVIIVSGEEDPSVVSRGFQAGGPPSFYSNQSQRASTESIAHHTWAADTMRR
jgi:CheY-like chemotaxis protein